MKGGRTDSIAIEASGGVETRLEGGGAIRLGRRLEG